MAINLDDPDPRRPRIPDGLPPQPLPPTGPVPSPVDSGSPYLPNLNQDAQTIPSDTIGDIPPPPVPQAPRPRKPTDLMPGGPAGAEGGTFARPGSVGMRPHRSPAAAPPRFGPGVPIVGSAPNEAVASDDIGLTPEEIEALMRGLAGGV